MNTTTLHHLSTSFSTYRRAGKVIAEALWSEDRSKWLVTTPANHRTDPWMWADSREEALAWVERNV